MGKIQFEAVWFKDVTQDLILKKKKKKKKKKEKKKESLNLYRHFQSSIKTFHVFYVLGPPSSQKVGEFPSLTSPLHIQLLATHLEFQPWVSTKKWTF